jgi:hypothetical protein
VGSIFRLEAVLAPCSLKVFTMLTVFLVVALILVPIFFLWLSHRAYKRWEQSRVDKRPGAAPWWMGGK